MNPIAHYVCRFSLEGKTYRRAMPASSPEQAGAHAVASADPNITQTDRVEVRVQRGEVEAVVYVEPFNGLHYRGQVADA